MHDAENIFVMKAHMLSIVLMNRGHFTTVHFSLKDILSKILFACLPPVNRKQNKKKKIVKEEAGAELKFKLS